MVLGAAYALLMWEPRDEEVRSAPGFQEPGAAESTPGAPSPLLTASATAVASRGSSSAASPAAITPVPFKEAGKDAPPEEPGGKQASPLKGVQEREPLEGRVVTPDGDPVEGARIMVRMRRNLADARDTRPLDGRVLEYELASDEQGGFNIKRYEDYVLIDLVLTAEDLGRKVVTDLRGPLEVVMARPAVVSGVVRTAGDYSPVAGALVTLRSHRDRRSTVTGEDGAYGFQGVPAGPALIQVSHPEYRPGRHWIQGLMPRQVYRRDFQLTPGLLVSGRVVDGVTGAALPGSEVLVKDRLSDQTVAVLHAADDGTFRLASLEADHPYCFVAQHEGYARMAELSTFHGGETMPEVVLELLPPWELGGEVRTTTGQPVAGASVHVTASLDGHVVRVQETVSSTSGAFTVGGLDPRATLLVRAYRPGYALRTLTGLTRASVQPGLLLVELVDEGFVEGRILDPQGEPVARVMVRVVPLAPDGSPSGPGVVAVAGGDGHFSVPGLPPGPVSVTTIAGGYQSSQVQAQAQPGQFPPLDVTIHPYQW